MKKIILLSILATTIIGFNIAAQQAKSKPSFGLITGLGANGTISFNNTNMGELNYTTKIGGGLVIPNFYITYGNNKPEDEQKLGYKLGYCAIQAYLPISVQSTQFVANPMYAADVQARYTLNTLHAQADYHLYKKGDEVKRTSIVIGGDLGYIFNAKTRFKILPFGTTISRNYTPTQSYTNFVNPLQVGGHIGWQYTKQLSGNKTLLAGYLINAFLLDFAKQPSTNFTMEMFTDGHNMVFSNLFYIGLGF
jgi:hypothetical protein